jgi:hypothetical protein
MIEDASKKLNKAMDSNGFHEFLETCGRGEGMYIILYEGERPTEIYIAGWSSH